MFEQLEMCRPGNYLPVTGSSGRELRPLRGENRGHISFFSSLFISFCLSPYPLLPSLSIFSHYFSVHTNRGQSLSCFWEQMWRIHVLPCCLSSSSFPLSSPAFLLFVIALNVFSETMCVFERTKLAGGSRERARSGRHY